MVEARTIMLLAAIAAARLSRGTICGSRLDKAGGEGTGATVGHQHAIEGLDRPVDQRQPQQYRGAGRLHAPAQAEDPLAVEAVDQVAGRQQQEQHRQKLRQADIGQAHRVAGQVIDLPGHHHREDLHGEHGQHTGGEERQETGLAIDGKFGGHGASPKAEKKTGQSTGSKAVRANNSRAHAYTQISFRELKTNQ
jgi:hypothetical protein